MYSTGNYTTRQALKNIASMPVIWFSLLAILLNVAGIALHPSLQQTIEIGAHASMCLQLIIFGVFLSGLHDLVVERRTLIYALINKFAFIPLLAFAVLFFAPVDAYIKTLVFLQLCMPLAVSNVNLASLYECKPYAVTAIILASSAIFMVVIFGYLRVFGCS